MLMLSTKIGKLFEMARKNMFAPMVSEGSSRATCWIDICRLLKPVPAVRLYADRRVCAVCSSLSTLWICSKISFPAEPSRSILESRE